MSAGDADDIGATVREGPPRDKPPTGENFARGTLIGRYVVIDILGVGGMGIVYSAFDPELDRRVAIKLLQAQPGGSESGGQTWLMREAQAMARLSHPNVVAVYDVGAMAGDLVFLAMELVDGMTLRSWLKRKQRTWREIVPVMRAAGAGIAAAHAAALVHRDFKPDNVLVGDDGRVRVMDFGLARLHGQADRTSDLSIERRSPLSERLTATGAVLGTPAYMAPEIYRGHGADAAGDQFAFGVALYEALYRVRPFERNSLVENRAIAPKPPPSHVPAWLERIALRAIALDPKQRFPAMTDLLAALGKDPSTTRSRVAIGIAAAAVCSGAVAFALRPTHHAEVCTDSQAKLDGVWDAKTRGAIEATFHALHNVDDSLRGTEKLLDTYATSWVSMRTQACQATRVHGSQSEDVLTLRMACLADRLVELETLAGLLAKADDKLASSAVSSAQKLSRITDCADITALTAPVPLPKDPGARITAQALHAKLAEARVNYKTSRLTDTLAVLAQITPTVMHLDYPPIEAELHLLTGQSLWVTAGSAKGEPDLLQAVWSAEAGRADTTKVEAWLQLTNLANESGRFAIAHERLQDAYAALARLGTNWDFKVRITAAEALLASREGKYDEARKIATRARELAEQHTDTQSIAYALLVEASLETSSGHGADAIAPLKKVLAIQEALGHRRIDVAVVTEQLASAELVVGDLDDAIKHLTDALEIARSIYGPENAEIARTMAALGAAQASKGDKAAGLATNLRALEIAAHTVGEHDEVYAFVSGQVADALIGLGRSKEAVPYIERALAIQTAKLGAGSVQALTLGLTKCDVLHETGSLKAAVEMCKRTLAAADKSLGKTSPMLFLFVAHTGVVLAEAKQTRDAHAMFDRALKLGAADPSDLYFVAMLDARALWDLGDHKRAVALARQARDGFAKLGDAKAAQVQDADAWLQHHASAKG